MSPWLIAARPKTLTAAVIPIICASALCISEGHTFKTWVSFFALCSAACIQIATNFINDLIDFRKGTDTIERSGPTRVSQAGLLSNRELIRGIYIVILLSIIFGAPLVWEGGLPILFIGLVSLLLAYGYTGGPLPLAYLGLGEIFVVLFFGVVAVSGVYFLHTEALNLSAVILGVQLGLLASVLIAINNLRDIDGDTKSNKKTLAVRFGARFARTEIAVFTLAPFIFGIWWIELSPLAFWFTIPTLLIAIKLLKLICSSETTALIQALPLASLYYLSYGVLLSLGLLIGSI